MIYLRWIIVLGLILPLAEPAHAAPASCRPTTSLLARSYGAPDDLATKGKTVLVGDTSAGVVAAINGRRRKILVRGLNVPEGIVVRPEDRLIVVEQGFNRLDLINLKNGHRSVFLQLRNITGLEGVDAISAIRNDLIIPNSPYGQLLRLHNGHLQTLTSRLLRPVDAIPYDGGFAVADENANAVWLVRRGSIRRLATVSIPDDLVVYHGRLLAVTLGDGALWEIRPQVVRLLGGFGQPQGLARLNPNALIVADSRKNAIYLVRLPVACLRSS